MPLKIAGSIIGDYHRRIVDDVYMTDSEAAVEGRGYYISSGRWTKSATTAAIEAICIKAATAGTDVLGVMELVKTGDVVEADYTGTADAAFIPGCKLITLDADGSNVNAAAVSAGHGRLLSKDTGKKICHFVPVKTFTCAS